MTESEQPDAERRAMCERLAGLVRAAGRMPKPMDRAWLDLAVAHGLVPKSALRHGVYYFGHCRNAQVAKWDAERRCFVYMRTKFGTTYPERINHPEDDDGFDLFRPVGEITPRDDERVPEEGT